jgi:hypothetical protein
LEPGQDLLGGRHRSQILAMCQIMARAARAKAQVVHDAVHGHHTHCDAALSLQQRLQVAQRPDEERQAIRLRPAVERLLHKGAVLYGELGRPAAA